MSPSFEGLGTVVELGGFSADAQRHLLAHLLDADEVDDDLFRLVERTCEGNPLYIEEMARYLLYQEQVAVAVRPARFVGLGLAELVVHPQRAFEVLGAEEPLELFGERVGFPRGHPRPLFGAGGSAARTRLGRLGVIP